MLGFWGVTANILVSHKQCAIARHKNYRILRCNKDFKTKRKKVSLILIKNPPYFSV